MTDVYLRKNPFLSIEFEDVMILSYILFFNFEQILTRYYFTKSSLHLLLGRSGGQ